MILVYSMCNIGINVENTLTGAVAHWENIASYSSTDLAKPVQISRAPAQNYSHLWAPAKPRTLI